MEELTSTPRLVGATAKEGLSHFTSIGSVRQRTQLVASSCLIRGASSWGGTRGSARSCSLVVDSALRIRHFRDAERSAISDEGDLGPGLR